MKSRINKIQAVRFVTNDLNRCQMCNEVGIDDLTMLDFHHLDPELSTELAREKGFWRSVRYKSWSHIRNELIKQKLAVVCRNCHMKIQATLFNCYKIIILEINDPSLINRELIKESATRISIKRHIIKKSIILDLLNGMCTKCGLGISHNDIDNLPALDIHHLVPKMKEKNFSDLLRTRTDINRIREIVKAEDCSCLCRNCHMMVQSTFFQKNKTKIFTKYIEKFGNFECY